MIAAMAFALSAPAGCGDATPDFNSNPSANCISSLTPCGGDLTGTWGRVRACSVYSPACIRDATVESTNLSRFSADGTFSTTEGADTTDSTLAGGCYRPGAHFAGQACADEHSNLSTGSSCAFEQSGECHCTGSNAYPGGGPGTWAANDRTMTITYSDGSMRTFDYCVSNGLMLSHLISAPSITINYYTRR